ncbi:MAG TPA: MGMT family protein [Clostridia bacterium]|nr:MGMT family protein [Clostridia bacterium]HPQ47656.1 MGMT family protein [Clostridia bacterium]HRX42671.1 MGMT family protein [Clostridia bacterium]
MARKTFNEKMNDSMDLPKISVLTDSKMIDRYGGKKLLIAPPIEYDEVMRRIPEGRLTTSVDIRKYLSERHGADETCPLTAGLFMNIVAEASEERGYDETPYWRSLKKGGELNAKYPGGLESQENRLKKEGHEIMSKGKRKFVKDYEKKLHILSQSKF